MKKSIALRKNPNMVERKIENETILLPLYKSSEEINSIYTLNKTASWIWDMIDGKREVSDIKKEALNKFDTTEKRFDKEMNKLLKDLKKIKAVK